MEQHYFDESLENIEHIMLDYKHVDAHVAPPPIHREKKHNHSYMDHRMRYFGEGDKERAPVAGSARADSYYF